MLTVAFVMASHVEGGVNQTGVIMHTVATSSASSSTPTHAQRAGVADSLYCHRLHVRFHVFLF